MVIAALCLNGFQFTVYNLTHAAKGFWNALSYCCSGGSIVWWFNSDEVSELVWGVLTSNVNSGMYNVCSTIIPLPSTDIMELKRMMEKLGQAKTHLELKKMIAEVDTNNSGDGGNVCV